MIHASFTWENDVADSDTVQREDVFGLFDAGRSLLRRIEILAANAIARPPELHLLAKSYVYGFTNEWERVRTRAETPWMLDRAVWSTRAIWCSDVVSRFIPRSAYEFHELAMRTGRVLDAALERSADSSATLGDCVSCYREDRTLDEHGNCSACAHGDAA